MSEEKEYRVMVEGFQQNWHAIRTIKEAKNQLRIAKQVHKGKMAWIEERPYVEWTRPPFT